MSDEVEKVGKNLTLGLVAFAIALLISLYYASFSASLAIFWLFGLAYGIVIQRSKFCFASAFRDLFLFKRGDLMKAVIVGLIVATIGFSIIMYATVELDKPIDSIKDGLPKNAKVNPVGLQTLLGGIIFGFGMVLSGGCASGTLWRVGEGYTVQWVALIGFILGTIPLAFIWGPLYDGHISKLPRIWFPEVIDHTIAAICHSGARFAYATMFLKVYGYNDVRNLDFGMSGWIEKGYPVIKEAS